jgi:hypothetical protein
MLYRHTCNAAREGELSSQDGTHSEQILSCFERSETGGGDTDGFAGGAGGRAPRGIENLGGTMSRRAREGRP